MDDTRIDAAPTPAHVFAYRAFRSVFVGSPESSPARPPPAESQNTSNDNKENTRLPTSRGSRFTTVPLQGKRDAEHVPETLNLSLTPKRQRTNSVSPTKSILKKSNVLTPRRAGLRDVTVTFKDLRASTSPELARKGSPTKSRSQPDLRNTLVALSSVAISAPPSKVVPISHFKNVKNTAKEQPAPQITAGFDLDGYIAQTEKEMRRLIKYGQKWRELARKQDEENGRLQTLLQELQKENERLKGRSNGIFEDANRLGQKLFDISKPAAQNPAEPKEYKPKVRQSEIEVKTRHVEKDRWKFPLEDIDTTKRRSKAASKPQEPQVSNDKPSRASADTSKSYQQTEPTKETRAHTTRKTSAAKVSLSGFLDSDKPLQQNKQVAPSHHKSAVPSIAQAPQLGNEPTKEFTKPALQMLSEDDRKAAARERLRLRREAKVAGLRASSAPVVKSSKFGQEVGGNDNEESQVDWMAIA